MARRRGFAHALLMMLAYLMEEPEFKFEEDRIVDLFKSVERWELNRTKQHDLSINKISEIIKENTGIVLKYEP